MANVRERGRSGFDPNRRLTLGGILEEEKRERERGSEETTAEIGTNRGRNDGHAETTFDRERGDRRRRDASRDSYYYDYDDDSGCRDRDGERARRGGDRELPYTRELPYKR